MTTGTQTHDDLLAATGRSLSERGYDVIVSPDVSILPAALRSPRPAAIALGRHPKLVIEIARDSPEAARRVAALQQALTEAPEWRLHLVLDRASASPSVPIASDEAIRVVLEDATHLAGIDARAALMLTWSALEALVRSRRPDDFARPQSPARVVERLASEGIVGPTEAAFLRATGASRNAVAHGDLSRAVAADEIVRFAEIVKDLISSPALAALEDGTEPTVAGRAAP